MEAEREQIDALVQEAQAAQESRAALIAATISASLIAWGQIDLRNIFISWRSKGLANRIYALLAAAQESVANDANSYISQAFETQGIDFRAPAVIPSSFAGIASDGRSLEGLVASAPVLAYERIRRGDSTAVARKAGEDFIRRAVTTQVADAGRTADQVAIVSAIPEQRRPSVRYGYVRMLQPPSCSRCIILAGRFYKWSEGFKRHEMCDCVHIPSIEDVAGDVTTDPYAYFKSLSKEEQDDAFGKANAEAIRQGADISQVVNATTRGGVRTAGDGFVYTTVGGPRRRSGNRPLRPTPWQIFRDADGSVDEARRLLRQWRYILR